MAVVNGSLTDVGWNALTPRMPILRFHPRTAVGTMSRRGDRLLSGTFVDATITGSVWTVDLVPTIGNVPLSWYALELIEIADDGKKSAPSWWWGAPIHVGADGGAFSALPGGPLSPESVWVGLTPPADDWVGWWLYQPNYSAGEEMPLDDPHIGDLIPGPGPFNLAA